MEPEGQRGAKTLIGQLKMMGMGFMTVPIKSMASRTSWIEIYQDTSRILRTYGNGTSANTGCMPTMAYILMSKIMMIESGRTIGVIF